MKFFQITFAIYILHIFHNAEATTVWVHPDTGSSSNNGSSADYPLYSISNAVTKIGQTSGTTFVINLIESEAYTSQHILLNDPSYSLTIQGVDTSGTARQVKIPFSPLQINSLFNSRINLTFSKITFFCPGNNAVSNNAVLYQNSYTSSADLVLRQCTFTPSSTSITANYFLIYAVNSNLIFESVEVTPSTTWFFSDCLIYVENPRGQTLFDKVSVSKINSSGAGVIYYSAAYPSQLELDSCSFTDCISSDAPGAGALYALLAHKSATLSFIGDTSTFTRCKSTAMGAGAMTLVLYYDNPDLETLTFKAEPALKFEDNTGTFDIGSRPVSMLISVPTLVSWQPLVGRMREKNQFAYKYYTPTYDWWLVGHVQSSDELFDLVNLYFPDSPPSEPMSLGGTIAVIVVPIVVVGGIIVVVLIVVHSKKKKKDKKKDNDKDKDKDKDKKDKDKDKKDKDKKDKKKDNDDDDNDKKKVVIIQIS